MNRASSLEVPCFAANVTISAENGFDRRPSAGPVTEGDVLANRYCVERRLASGGSATVFRAFDTQLECHVALKVFGGTEAQLPGWRRRLVREVRLARQVRSAHVCPVFDLGVAGGLWFMTMELARGALREELVAHERRPPSDAEWSARAADARALCAGLAAVHERSITHGDLTPGNVLRMFDGRLALADFGLARRDDDRTRESGGTLRYLAPEVMMGAAPDRRADVWQLGLLLHEILLGGRPPWRFDDTRVVAAADAPARQLPREIRALLTIAGRCLSWSPARRPADARVVLLEVARSRLAD